MPKNKYANLQLNNQSGFRDIILRRLTEKHILRASKPFKITIGLVILDIGCWLIDHIEGNAYICKNCVL